MGSFSCTMAVPALIGLLITLGILRFGIIKQVSDSGDQEIIAKYIHYAIPLGVLLIPLATLAHVCYKRSQDRQMVDGDDDFADFEAVYVDEPRQGKNEALVRELKATVLPTAKLKLLKNRLRNPRLHLTVNDCKAILETFQGQHSTDQASEMLHQKLEKQKKRKK